MTDPEEPSDLMRPMLVPDLSLDRPRPMDWDVYVEEVMMQWRALLDSAENEKEVQEFLELHPCLIPGGSGDIGPGGNHGSEMGAVFRQPPLTGLGAKQVPDFMWVTRSSGLITPILIEIEKPSKRWFTRAGQPTAEYTQAYDQLNRWRAWFQQPANVEIFRKTYLFDSRFDHIALRPHFLLVYGRRSEFEHPTSPHKDPKSLIAKRDLQCKPDETFMSYDSLEPDHKTQSAMTVTMPDTAQGPRAFALSPLFGVSPDSGEDSAILADLDEALGRTVMMTDERKAYIAERWSYWREIFEEDARRMRGRIRQFGLE